METLNGAHRIETRMSSQAMSNECLSQWCVDQLDGKRLNLTCSVSGSRLCLAGLCCFNVFLEHVKKQELRASMEKADLKREETE